MRPALIATFVLVTMGSLAHAQGTGLNLGTGAFDSGLPVEVSADEFTVNQDSGEAAFIGNVVVVQGDIRMSAGEVRVISGDPDGGVSRLIASGGVTFVTPTEAAEARDAVYSVDDGNIVMTGDVLLTQGATAISGQSLTVDLQSGEGRMEGRVRTVFGAGSE